MDDAHISPSKEQIDIIEHNGNAVVIANPGSGKTTTLSFKIAKVLDTIEEWNGVVAISYTNKASNELEARIRQKTNSTNNCFFGTIDKFYLSQIILPFSKSAFVIKTSVFDNLKIVKKDDLPEIIFGKMSDKQLLESLYELIKGGILVLEYTAIIALDILNNSINCQNYIKSRYKHIFIDEYQDCNREKHSLFLKLVNLGLIGTAVGDPNQAIFGFAGSNPDLLFELTARADFLTFPLSVNRRCNQQIIDYSVMFLNPGQKAALPSDFRIHLRNIDGDETACATWINNNLDRVMKQYNVTQYSQVAILTVNRRTGSILSNHLNKPHKLFVTTAIDESSLYTDSLFKQIMMYIFGHEHIFIDDIVDDNFIYSSSKIRESFKQYVKEAKIKYLKEYNVDFIDLLEKYKKLFSSQIDTHNIENVISDSASVESFIPLREDELSILTIHKAKGLEFKIVIVLDVHKYILPKYDFDSNTFPLLNNDRCMLYVAITRAKESVIFLVNNQRTNSKGIIIQGITSEFLDGKNRVWGFLANYRSNK